MKIPVYFKSYKKDVPNDGYWDYEMIKDLFNNELWSPVSGYEFEFFGNTELYTDGAVIVIPARYHFDMVEEINKDIAQLKWVIIMLIGDEDGKFPTEKIVHPNKKVYLMLPHEKKANVDRYLPNGYATGIREYLKDKEKNFVNKEYGWFFSGQVTHSRRKELVAELRNIDTNNGYLNETAGFTQGLKQSEYLDIMTKSKVALCPSGAVVPDSFRFYEALECGVFPIVDNKSPNDNVKGFWKLIFPDYELPFPLIESWAGIKDTINFHNDVYPKTANRVFAWWMQYKRNLAYNLASDIYQLSGIPADYSLKNKLTVIMPTSFIKAHPDTSIIEQVIKTVREHLPDCEIIITFDGLREEYKQFEPQYEEYIRRMLWKCHHEYKNVLPVIMPEHKHQIGQAREVIGMVKTSCVMYVEHDAPICEEIPFEKIIKLIERGEFNVMRLHHEALILDVHKHLMLDKEPITVDDLPFVRTGQWSQRPHIALTEFYKKMLFEYFKPSAYGMIEDGILGRVQDSFFTRGLAGWNEYKVAIYAPPRDMKRSWHLDGRGQESKFEDSFKYV